MHKKTIKLGLIGLLALFIVGFFASGFYQEFTLESVKERAVQLTQMYEKNQMLTLIGFSLFYITVAMLSLPGATFLSIAAGAFLGFWPGLVIASFASSIGATLAFLIARYLLRNTVQAKFGDRLKKINEGIRQEGIFYLFALRLTVMVPFSLVNFLMALTPISAIRFYLVSQLAMLPATIIYTYAGSQLAQIHSVSDVLSLELIIALTLLGLFPLTVKKAAQWLRNKNLMPLKE